MGSVECGLCGKTRTDPRFPGVPGIRMGVCPNCAEEQHRLDQEEEGKRAEARQCPECNQMAFVNDPDFGVWYCLDCKFETEELQP